MPKFKRGDFIRRVAKSTHTRMGHGAVHKVVDVAHDGWLRLEIDDSDNSWCTHGWDPGCFELEPQVLQTKEDLEALYG